MTNGQTRQEAMGGLAKGLAILESFSAEVPRMTVTDASQASGTTPAAARRCLLTLVDLGYLTHDGKYYRPTPRVARLTRAYSATASLPTLGQPCLLAVRDELEQSASLAVLEGGESLFVARAEAARIASAGVRVGTTLPLWASSTGRVLATTLTEDALSAVLEGSQLERRTPKTVVSRSAVRKLIESAREDGVAYTDEELELGVRTMAVPVVDSAGVTQAAMSVSAFAAQVSMSRMRDEFLPVLRREAQRLGRML
ncbi:IclR family transcriptional regulator domain-containing protein [Nocardioides pyridinolyticus]